MSINKDSNTASIDDLVNQIQGDGEEGKGEIIVIGAGEIKKDLKITSKAPRAEIIKEVNSSKLTANTKKPKSKKINQSEALIALKEKVASYDFNNVERTYIDEDLGFKLQLIKIKTKIPKGDLISYAINKFLEENEELKKYTK